MKKYYKATVPQSDGNVICADMTGNLGIDEELTKQMNKEVNEYFVFDTETRIVDLYYAENVGGLNPDAGTSKSLSRPLNKFDDPRRYICEHWLFDEDEIRELTREEVEEEMFTEAL